MYQKNTIIGRLGRDPEMKYTPSGQAVTNFSVATDRSYTSKSEEKVKETIWFRVESWGKLAEVCNLYLQKGALVQVEGRIKAPRVYTKSDGTSDCQLEIVAESVLFLGGTKSNEKIADETF